MRHWLVACGTVAAGLGLLPQAVADGAFFFPGSGTAADLAQTRQEVVIAFYRDDTGTPASNKALYVLRSRYTGTPPETFAWVIPLPASPTDIVAHQNDLLFDELALTSEPVFYLDDSRMPLGCVCAQGGPGGRQGKLVDVEAQGQAGLFDWAVLTSTGAGALLEWLNENGFAVPGTAANVLARYIDQEMHFLAVRVREPEQIKPGGDGIAIPPIQFTCQTDRRFYPMVISQISAAAETEVVVYVLADHRVEAANVANAVIDRDAVAFKADSPSLSNYEDLFADTLAQNNGLVLVTEYAGNRHGRSQWVTAPPAVLDLRLLTRLRTVVARDRLTVDFEFQDAADDTWVDNYFVVDDRDFGGFVLMLGTPVLVLLAWTRFHKSGRRRPS